MSAETAQQLEPGPVPQNVFFVTGAPASSSPILFGVTSQLETNPPGKVRLRYLVTRSFEEVIVDLWRRDLSVHGWAITT